VYVRLSVAQKAADASAQRTHAHTLSLVREAATHAIAEGFRYFYPTAAGQMAYVAQLLQRSSSATAVSANTSAASNPLMAMGAAAADATDGGSAAVPLPFDARSKLEAASSAESLCGSGSSRGGISSHEQRLLSALLAQFAAVGSGARLIDEVEASFSSSSFVLTMATQTNTSASEASKQSENSDAFVAIVSDLADLSTAHTLRRLSSALGTAAIAAEADDEECDANHSSLSVHSSSSAANAALSLLKNVHVHLMARLYTAFFSSDSAALASSSGSLVPSSSSSSSAWSLAAFAAAFARAVCDRVCTLLDAAQCAVDNALASEQTSTKNAKQQSTVNGAFECRCRGLCEFPYPHVVSAG
jgi:hypothetical protein